MARTTVAANARSLASDIADQVRVEKFSLDVRDSNDDGAQDLVVDVRVALTIDPRVWVRTVLGYFR